MYSSFDGELVEMMDEFDEVEEEINAKRDDKNTVERVNYFFQKNPSIEDISRSPSCAHEIGDSSTTSTVLASGTSGNLASSWDAEENWDDGFEGDLSMDLINAVSSNSAKSVSGIGTFILPFGANTNNLVKPNNIQPISNTDVSVSPVTNQIRRGNRTDQKSRPMSSNSIFVNTCNGRTSPSKSILLRVPSNDRPKSSTTTTLITPSFSKNNNSIKNRPINNTFAQNSSNTHLNSNINNNSNINKKKSTKHKGPITIGPEEYKAMLDRATACPIKNNDMIFDEKLQKWIPVSQSSPSSPTFTVGATSTTASPIDLTTTSATATTYPTILARNLSIESIYEHNIAQDIVISHMGGVPVPPNELEVDVEDEEDWDLEELPVNQVTSNLSYLSEPTNNAVAVSVRSESDRVDSNPTYLNTTVTSEPNASSVTLSDSDKIHIENYIIPIGDTSIRNNKLLDIQSFSDAPIHSLQPPSAVPLSVANELNSTSTDHSMSSTFTDSRKSRISKPEEFYLDSAAQDQMFAVEATHGEMMAVILGTEEWMRIVDVSVKKLASLTPSKWLLDRDQHSFERQNDHFYDPLLTIKRQSGLGIYGTDNSNDIKDSELISSSVTQPLSTPTMDIPRLNWSPQTAAATVVRENKTASFSKTESTISAPKVSFANVSKDAGLLSRTSRVHLHSTSTSSRRGASSTSMSYDSSLLTAAQRATQHHSISSNQRPPLSHPHANLLPWKSTSGPIVVSHKVILQEQTQSTNIVTSSNSSFRRASSPRTVNRRVGISTSSASISGNKNKMSHGSAAVAIAPSVPPAADGEEILIGQNLLLSAIIPKQKLALMHALWEFARELE